MDTCPECRAPIQATDRSCPKCGAEFVLDGKYRLERLLGKGGMGAVWLAYEVALDRHVAIKVPAESLREDAGAVSGFEREARLMAKVEHPNLVPVYTVGQWRGLPYIVMKVLEGRSLAELNAERRFALPQILSMMTQLCAGLQCLHDNHIIHRDVKPANIIVDANERITLVDLGIARNLEANATQSGVSHGTPRYMAPEQVLREKVDHRVDIYAAGAVLYELLTGKRLFDETQDDSLLRTKIFRDLHRPPGIEAPVWAVLKRALARERQDRFSSAAEFASAIETALDPEGSSRGAAQALNPPRAEPTVTLVATPPATLAESTLKRPPGRFTWGVFIGGGVLALIAAVAVIWGSSPYASAAGAKKQAEALAPSSIAPSDASNVVSGLDAASPEPVEAIAQRVPDTPAALAQGTADGGATTSIVRPTGARPTVRTSRAGTQSTARQPRVVTSPAVEPCESFRSRLRKTRIAWNQFKRGDGGATAVNIDLQEEQLADLEAYEREGCNASTLKTMEPLLEYFISHTLGKKLPK